MLDTHQPTYLAVRHNSAELFTYNQILTSIGTAGRLLKNLVPTNCQEITGKEFKEISCMPRLPWIWNLP